MTPFDDSPPMASTTHPADALVLTGVHVHRGDGAVLHGIDLTFPAGRITAIVGRSGVGKSTLIATLNGLIHPEAGTIAVPGVGRIDDAGALREHRRRAATIFQDHALIDRLSALDNVLLGLADQRHPLSLLPWPEEFRRRAARKSG